MPEPQIDWNKAVRNFRMRDIPPPKIEPPIDKVVSSIVGKKIYLTDPRLINLVSKWRKQSNKSPNSMEPDNFLNDPNKIKELKEILGKDFN